MTGERKFTSLLELLGNKDRIRNEAASSGHDGFFPTAVTVPTAEGKTETRGQVNPAPPKDDSKRGRILVFVPTKEKVTVLREKVGQSYRGEWLHEVTTRDGHKFLALEKQLKSSV